jgi:hypothetical protein
MAASRLAAAASGARKTGVSYQSLVCGSVAAFASRLQSQFRVVALDVTSTHVGVAVSDRDRRRAAPFGILARSGSVSHDARSLARAFAHANREDSEGSLNVGGLIVGTPPHAHDHFEYIDGLIQHGADDTEIVPPFPELSGVLFYSEAAALERTLAAADDIVRAMSLLPERLETRKFNRYATAMHPRVSSDDLNNDAQSRARIAASDILQVVLDEMSQRIESGER